MSVSTLDTLAAGCPRILDNPARADLAALVGPGGTAPVRGVTRAPAGWEVVRTGHGVQLVDTALRAEPDPGAVRLGPADVPEIPDLVARTEPGHRGRGLAAPSSRSSGTPGPPPRKERHSRAVRLHPRPHTDLQEGTRVLDPRFPSAPGRRPRRHRLAPRLLA